MLAELAGNDVAALGLDLRGADREAIVQYLTGAFMALMTWWLNDGARIPVDELDARFSRLAMQGIARL
jgi:Transcriptional regulator C-terminal region